MEVCFPRLDLLVPVPMAVFITQPRCANKPHMFWFSSYRLSQDKVEISVLPETRDSLHTQTHTQWQGAGMGLTHLCFLQHNTRLTQRRHSMKAS